MQIPVGWKGSSKRTPAQQIALAVRIVDNKHWQDALQRAKDELGDRALQIGPLDITRNTLRTYVRRAGPAYLTPPMTDDLDAGLAAALGDYSAKTLVKTYAEVSARPMPTDMIKIGYKTLRYQLAAGYAGTMIGHSDRLKHVVLHVISPAALSLEYSSEDPNEPTIIRYSCNRALNGELTAVVDEYDLTDLDKPHYRVISQGSDVTGKIYGRTFEGDDYWWRYSDGTPYHRIVIRGHPDDAYETEMLIETTLKMCALWTHWGAGIRDAGHPQRHVANLMLAGSGSDSGQQITGVSAAPETVMSWEVIDPDKEIAHWQDAPGFDPEVIGRSLRGYELTPLSAMGLPVDYERTGGEPTESEHRALQELIAATYPESRRSDGEIYRRAAATMNRATAADDKAKTTDYREDRYATLYRDEVERALVPEEVENGGEDNT